MQETWVWSLGWKDPLEKGMATHSSILAWRILMDRGTSWATVHEVAKSQTRLTKHSIVYLHDLASLKSLSYRVLRASRLMNTPTCWERSTCPTPQGQKLLHSGPFQISPHSWHPAVHLSWTFIMTFIIKWNWSEITQSHLTLCDPMDCSLLGSSIHGIFQARLLEWVAISFSRSSQPRDWTQVSHTVGRCFTVWATREVPLY